MSAVALNPRQRMPIADQVEVAPCQRSCYTAVAAFLHTNPQPLCAHELPGSHCITASPLHCCRLIQEARQQARAVRTSL